MSDMSQTVYPLNVRMIFALVLIPVLLAVGCGDSSAGSHTQAFVSSQLSEAVELGLKLSRTQVPHRIVRHTVVGGQYDFDRYQHAVEFAPMSRADFDSLKETYAGFSLVKSSVSFVSGRQYSLMDFLPPVMQSILNLKFQEETTAITLSPGQTASASTVANCWGTVYEVLRESKLPMGGFSVFYAHDDVMQEFLRNPAYSRIVKPYTKNREDFQDRSIRNRGLSPGDVVVVGGEWLYHVAIFLDDDLFFEKSGSGSKTLFRLVTYDVLATTWNPEIYGWSFRRFDEEILPDPMDLFSVRAVFGDDANLPKITDAVARELSVVRSEVNGTLRHSYFLRKRYPIRP